MYFREFVDREPHPELGRHAESMRMLRASGMPVPGIYQLFNARPKASRHLFEFTEELMRGPGALAPELRERIAAWTSARNRCSFCHQGHAAVAAYMTEDPEMVDAVCRNPAEAPVSEKERALYVFLEKVNDAPHSVAREDIEAAREAGLSEEEMFEAVTVCAAFNFYNRWVSSSGVEAMPQGFWEGFLAAQGGLTYTATGAQVGGPAKPAPGAGVEAPPALGEPPAPAL